MATEYKKIVWIILSVSIGYIEPIYFAIFYGLYLIYKTYYQTPLFHTLIPPKNRYFIRSSIDGYVKKKLIITGIVLILLGIVWFFINDLITINEYLKNILLLLLLFEGLYHIVTGLWMLPATELRFTDTDVTLLRDSEVFRKIDDMTDFEISDDKIRIFRPDKSLEIGELTLKEDQKKALSDALETLKNKIQTIRKNTRRLEYVYKERRKSFFRFKI